VSKYFLAREKQSDHKEGYRDEATGITYPADSILEIEVRGAEDDVGPLPDPFSIN